MQEKLARRGLVVLLDERGEQLSSRQFATKLSSWISGAAKPVQFVVGAADGVTEEMRRRADFVLSLGSMTFAHRMVRAILAEQLYRAASILAGTPYHRE